MEILLYSFGAVAPLVACSLLGFWVRRRGVVGDDFVARGNTLCFRYIFPFMMVKNVYEIDFSAYFDPALMGFCIAGVVAVMLAAWLVVPIFVKNRARRSSFIVGAFRTNNLIFGIPIATSLFGDSGKYIASMIVPISVILFNFLGVIVMCSYAEDRQASMGATLKRTAIDILQNPLIIGSVLGIAISALQIRLPEILVSSIGTIGGIGTPLSLILLGAQLDLAKIGGNIRQVLALTFVRLVLVPSIVIPVAIALGFHGPELGSIFILFSAPVAVTVLVMANNYKLDPEFVAQTVILSTALSAVTIFIGISLLRYWQFI